MRPRYRRRPLAAALVAGALLAGCGAAAVGPQGDEPAAETQRSSSEDDGGSEMDAHGQMMDGDEEMDSDVHDEMMGEDAEEARGGDAPVDVGEAADPADAARTIEVEAFDMAFTPERIEVEAGEVVTFVVTNTGQAVHEFTLGDAAMQEEHAHQMADDGHAHDEPNSISVDPGETKELTWRFGDGGTVEYACHEPGHYQAGMYGEIISS
jgi:uncharacterized cupredoxin-like copper-binding protein